MELFGKQWFKKYQPHLLAAVNFPVPAIRQRVRESIGMQMIDDKIKIKEIGIDHFIGTLDQEHSIFVGHSSNPISKKVKREYFALWDFFHRFDMQFANRLFPRLNLGFDKFYSDASPEVTSMDGQAGTNTDQKWSNAHAHSINDDDSHTSVALSVRIAQHYSGFPNMWSWWYRSFSLFDLSSITPADILSAKFVATVRSNPIDNHPSENHTLVITQAETLSNTVSDQYDYDRCANFSTYFSDDVAYLNTVLANDVVEYNFNADGLTYLQGLSGDNNIAKIGIKLGIDADNTEPATWGTNQEEGIYLQSVDNGTDIPYLEVILTNVNNNNIVNVI